MTLADLGRPGAKVQKLRSGIFRLGPEFGTICWGKMLWFKSQRWEAYACGGVRGRARQEMC